MGYVILPFFFMIISPLLTTVSFENFCSFEHLFYGVNYLALGCVKWCLSDDVKLVNLTFDLAKMVCCS